MSESHEPVPNGESADGVDLTLIRWMLSLSPAERLDVLQGFVDGIAALTKRGDRG